MKLLKNVFCFAYLLASTVAEISSVQKTITTLADGAQSVYAADIDGDGDMDVLSASFSGDTGDNKIAWYENTDAQI